MHTSRQKELELKARLPRVVGATGPGGKASQPGGLPRRPLVSTLVATMAWIPWEAASLSLRENVMSFLAFQGLGCPGLTCDP